MFIHVAKFSLFENGVNDVFRDFPIRCDNVLMKIIIVFLLLSPHTWLSPLVQLHGLGSQAEWSWQ